LESYLLKNKADIEHTRHRSTINFEVNIWAALIAYTYNDRLPAVKPFVEIFNSRNDMSGIDSANLNVA
jgi:hypothetical protein